MPCRCVPFDGNIKAVHCASFVFICSDYPTSAVRNSSRKPTVRHSSDSRNINISTYHYCKSLCAIRLRGTDRSAANLRNKSFGLMPVRAALLLTYRVVEQLLTRTEEFGTARMKSGRFIQHTFTAHLLCLGNLLMQYLTLCMSGVLR